MKTVGIIGSLCVVWVLGCSGKSSTGLGENAGESGRSQIEVQGQEVVPAEGSLLSEGLKEGSHVSNDFFTLDSHVVVGDPESYSQIQESVFWSYYKHRLSDSGSCTNTYISDQGHYITAAHCIQSCVNRHNGLYGSIFTIRDLSQPGYPIKDGFNVINRSQVVGKKCLLVDESGVEREMELIAVGPSLPISGNPFHVIHRQLDAGQEDSSVLVKLGIAMLEGLTNNMDFAILRDPQVAETSCVPVSAPKEEDQVSGEPVWTLSYPGETQWPGENLANGKKRLVSQGQVLVSYREDPEMTKFVDSKNWFSANSPAAKDKIFNLPYTRIVNAPVNVGSSGSAIFDRENKILGITSFIMDNKNKPGGAYIIDIHAIIEYLSDEYGELSLDEVFRCSGQKITVPVKNGKTSESARGVEI